MRTKVNNVVWVAVTAIAATALYFQISINKESVSNTNTLESDALRKSHQTLFSTQEKLAATTQKLLQVTNRSKPSTIKLQQNEPGSTDKHIPVESKTKPIEQSLPPTVEAKHPEKITDEDAKKVIPYPFNLALGIFKENDRERYKEFSDAQQSDDWDITMQGQLVDAIYSHPNANALTIDSVSCKAHICELRLSASNTKAWPLVLADLRLQPWWDFGNNLSMYEFGIKQDTQIKTVYFILLHKH